MKQYIGEFFGTALLLMIVTGSGLMGDTLSAGNPAVTLLGNSIATGAGLYVLIVLLAPISGAHFNPVVSLVSWRLGNIRLRKLLGFSLSQFSGAILGVCITHVLFGLEVIQTSNKIRTGLGIWVSEFLSTLILLSVIHLGERASKDRLPMLVSLTVTAGYWFTSSTFFANPAVALARSMTDTFVGISPSDVFGFILAECLAAWVFLVIALRFKANSAVS